jgi:hypothetical protein
LTIVSFQFRDRAMAVSGKMRRAYSLALCGVGECGPPLRSGSIGTKGIEIVVGDDATLAWESSFSCSVISMRSRCTTALLRRFWISFRSSHAAVLKREDARNSAQYHAQFHNRSIRSGIS